jgi:hypothetical protein
MNELIVKFLSSCIDILTTHKDFCFFALTDLDYETLDMVSNKIYVEGVSIQQVNRKDSGAAIKLRNNANVKKIVLLSAESIKRMESLKDFIEVNIFDDMEFFFKAINKTFEIKQEFKKRPTLIEKYIKTIISEQRNSLDEFLNYFEACKKGDSFDDVAVNEKLPILGIWSLDSTNTSIVKLRRAIKFSDYSNFEKIVQAVENNPEDNFTNKERSALIRIRNSDDLSNVFKLITFEKIDAFIKNNRITTNKKPKTENVADIEKNTSESYFFSYDYIIDNYLEDIESYEELLNKDFMSEEPMMESFSFAMEIAQNLEINKDIIDNNLNEFINKLESSNISESKRREIKVTIEKIVTDYKNAIILPITLKSFCEESYSYCQSYFELICKFVIDDELSAACYTNDIIESILLIFSQKEKKGVRLSFRHPISVFYFLTIKEIYEQAVLLNQTLNERYEYSLSGLIERLIYKFPIEMLKLNNSIYYYNNVQANPFEIVFTEDPMGISQAKVGFKSISKYLAKFEKAREFYLPEIKVCILGDIMPQSLGYLLRSISDDESRKNTNFIFEFICSNEEMIKNAIEESIENQSLIENGEFKFTSYKYSTDSQNHPNISQIIQDNDIIFISNSSVLYTDGYFQKDNENYKAVMDMMSDYNLEETINESVYYNRKYFKSIIDTLQARVENSENCVYIWQNHTLNNNSLSEITCKTKDDTSKSVVIFSSNLDINKRIHNGHFEPEIFEERGYKYLGIYFNRDIIPNALNKTTTNSILISYIHLIEAIVTEPEVTPLLKKIFSQEVVNYNEAKLKIEIKNYIPCLSVILQNNLEEYYVETESEMFLNYIKKIWEIKDNILSKKMREIIINFLQEYCTSYSQCLLVEYLKSCIKLEVSSDYKIEENQEIFKDTHSAATKEVFDLLDFINSKHGTIDEQSFSYIRKNFEFDVIKNLCESINSFEFVEYELQKKGLEILRKWE